MKLKDRVALITGGSTGIGRAAAVAMAREGANIALTARRAERCEEAVAEIEGLGGQALALPGDVANAEHVAELVAATVEPLGPPRHRRAQRRHQRSLRPYRGHHPLRSGIRRRTSTCAAPSSPLNTPSPICARLAAAASSSSPRSTATASSPISASPRIPAPRPPK